MKHKTGEKMEGTKQEKLETLMEISEYFKGYNVLIGNRLAFVSRDGKTDTFKIKD